MTIQTSYNYVGNINRYIVSLVNVNDGTTHMQHVIDLNKRKGLPLSLTVDNIEREEDVDILLHLVYMMNGTNLLI